ALREQTLIRTTGPSPADAVDAYHARVRDAVLAHLAADERRRLHATLAARLEALPAPDAEAVAEHWYEAGQPGRAQDHWVEAAAPPSSCCAPGTSTRGSKACARCSPTSGSISRTTAAPRSRACSPCARACACAATGSRDRARRIRGGPRASRCAGPRRSGCRWST